MKRLLVFFLCLLPLLTLASGCGHKKKRPAPPPPPPTSRRSTPPRPRPPAPITPQPPVTSSEEDAEFVETHKPIYSEDGYASWYGPPYHNRRGANGQIFDQNALTAAHRTLPMNALIKVTNQKTGQAAVMRVTDRGPFVTDRVIDLSMGSAKAVGIYIHGTAPVRIDVYQTPKPIEEGGRWCVQIGAFTNAKESLKLKDHLTRKYSTAQVIEFTGPTGHWVRIRPENDDKGKAIAIAKELKPSEGYPYLVRLD